RGAGELPRSPFALRDRERRAPLRGEPGPARVGADRGEPESSEAEPPPERPRDRLHRLRNGTLRRSDPGRSRAGLDRLRSHHQRLAESRATPTEASRHPNPLAMNPVPDDPLGPLLEALQRSGRALDLAKIRAAYAFAVKAHGSQLRLTGEPYV